jgi:hypothetical protein
MMLKGATSEERVQAGFVTNFFGGNEENGHQKFREQVLAGVEK